MRHLPIRLRLALWFSALLAAAVVAVGTLLITLLETELQHEIDEDLGVRAARVERELLRSRQGSTESPSDGRLDLDQVAAGLHEVALPEELAAPGIYVLIVDSQGTVLGASANLPGGALPLTGDALEAVRAGDERYVTLEVGAERARVYVRPLRGPAQGTGAILAGESLHLLDVTRRAMRQTLGIAAGAAAFVCLAAGWWLTGRALAPVADVTKAAARIQSGGRFEERIPEPAARDELRALAITFNDMLTAIDATLTRERELVADASHELRGPLMVIRGNLGLMRLDLPEDERAAALQDAAEEVEHMCRLVADLLFLAEEDAGQAIGHEAVAMDGVVREVYDRAWRLDGRSHELSLDIHGAGVVNGDRPRLLQMVWNLVENALRYTSAGGKVAISMITTDSAVEVAVADAGIGISQQDLPHVFDRFYRADPTRAHRNGSTGLGLAIVKQTALAHGAVVHVQSEEGQGSTFRVVLPQARTMQLAERNDPYSPPAS